MVQPHQDRIQAAVSAFQTANDALVAALGRLDGEAAARVPQDGGWSAAQIGWHVAATNEFLAGLLTGTIPGAMPAPAGFEEDAVVFSRVPVKVDTFPTLKPPSAVSYADALAKLRTSAAQTVNAIESLAPERASGYCVQFPFGTVTVYQVAEFAALHAVRHQGQLQRVVALV